MNKWDNIDWSLPDFQIAKKLNLSSGTVGNKRRKLGIKPARAKGMRDCYWLGIDWTKRSEIISKETGRSIAAVNSARGRYASPNLPKPPRKLGVLQQKQADLNSLRALAQNLLNRAKMEARTPSNVVRDNAETMLRLIERVLG